MFSKQLILLNQVLHINTLQQLGYENTSILGQAPLSRIMTKADDILKGSYSVKYIGVVDNNMGILSRRLKLDKQQHLNEPLKKYQNFTEQTQYLPPVQDFVICKYSLPKGLKPLHIRDENEDRKDKEKNEIKDIRDKKFSGFIKSPSMNTQSQTSLSRSTIQRKNYKGGWVKPPKKEEEFEEGSYAVLEEQKQIQGISFSRILNKMGQGVIPVQHVDQSLPGKLKYTLNLDQLERIEKIKNRKDLYQELYDNFQMTDIEQQLQQKA